MTIASITTFGFGAYSTINLAVTLGYGSGAVPVVAVDTHDYPDHWRKKLKRQQQAVAAREKEKRAQATDLRRLIEQAANPPVPFQNLPRHEKKALKAQQAHIPDWQGQLELIENEIRLLVAEIQLQAMVANKRREEDDIQAILLALNASFQTKH